MAHARDLKFLLAALPIAPLVACDDAAENEETGAVSVRLEAEDVIIDGLTAGDGDDQIADGWSVSFDKYIVSIGDIDVAPADGGGAGVEAADVFAVDLTEIPANGLALWQLDALPVGRWTIGYATVGAGDGATRHETVSQGDFDAMLAADSTYYIEGELSAPAGESCPPAALATPGDATPTANTSSDGDPCYAAPAVRFVFGAPAETAYGPCEIDGVPGFAVAAGATQTIALTLHGDHLFFNGFPENDEGGVTRLAQWLADCDLDLDGTVTQAELEAIAPSDLAAFDDRFVLGGSPITPLNTMYDYVRAQLKTQGHFQGEGECPVDGVAHDHGHDHDDDHDHEGEHEEGEHEGHDHE